MLGKRDQYNDQYSSYDDPYSNGGGFNSGYNGYNDPYSNNYSNDDYSNSGSGYTDNSGNNFGENYNGQNMQNNYSDDYNSNYGNNYDENEYQNSDYQNSGFQNYENNGYNQEGNYDYNQNAQNYEQGYNREENNDRYKGNNPFYRNAYNNPPEDSGYTEESQNYQNYREMPEYPDYKEGKIKRKKGKRKKIILILVILALLAGGGFAGYKYLKRDKSVAMVCESGTDYNKGIGLTFYVGPDGKTIQRIDKNDKVSLDFIKNNLNTDNTKEIFNEYKKNMQDSFNQTKEKYKDVTWFKASIQSTDTYVKTTYSFNVGSKDFSYAKAEPIMKEFTLDYYYNKEAKKFIYDEKKFLDKSTPLGSIENVQCNTQKINVKQTSK